MQLKILFDDTKSPIQVKLDNYPKNKDGRSFQIHWFDNFPWLEYSISRDAAFCFYCRMFCKEHSVYKHKGFVSWSSATLKFKSHEATKSHSSAKIAFQARQRAKDQSCAVLLDKNHASVKERNRSMLVENMKLLLLLAKQNIALRGHDESKASLNKGNYRAIRIFGNNKQRLETVNQR